MAVLTIDLQEGFTGETVVIAIDGQAVERRPGVKTRLQTGLAESLNVQVPMGSLQVSVSVPEKGADATIAVDASTTPWLGVSLDAEGGIRLQPSATMFGYL